MLKYPVAAQSVFSSQAYAAPLLVPHPLGTEGFDRFGRAWRFCQAGAADLVVGNVIQAAAQLTDEQVMTPTAAAIGATSISVTPGGTAARAADLFAGGLAVIDTTPGIGYSYPIKQHLGFTEPAAFVVNLARGWEIVVALTATSRVNVYSNPWKNVIQAPATTLTNVVVGVCAYIITTVEYGWICTSGPCGVLLAASVSIAISTMIGSPSGTAGAAVEHSGVIQPIGVLMDTGANDKVQQALLNIV